MSLNLLFDKNLIGGLQSASCSGRTFAVLNPADGSLLANVPDSAADELIEIKFNRRTATEAGTEACDDCTDCTGSEAATLAPIVVILL